MTDKWFKDFENRPILSKDKIPWPITIEFEIQSTYLISNLRSLPGLNVASDAELLSAAEHCNNLCSWMEQMRIMGYPGLPAVLEDLLEKEFGNRQQLAYLRLAYIGKWLHGKAGQYKIGENDFFIHQSKFYYSNLKREWFEVEPEFIFEIMPILSEKADSKTNELLGANYKPTRYQEIYTNWLSADYSGKLLPVFSSSKTGQTTPEDVLEYTIKKLRSVIERPLAIEEIEQAIDNRTDHLEYLIKISCLVADFAQRRRASTEHSLYLLRDCAMFHEAQIFIDFLEGQETSHDQVYLGRESFSSKQRNAGHWYVAQELLLISLQKYPDDFNGFHTDFMQCMRDYEEYSPEFAALVQSLAQYLNAHIGEAKQDNRTINVIDLGFQGSINMVVKYVLDQYCLQETKLRTKIHMYVVAEWFKGVYKGMYTSNTFSALSHIEVMARNNAIYKYVPWSLADGKLSVTYGSKTDQGNADIELAVMAMSILVAKQFEIT